MSEETPTKKTPRWLVAIPVLLLVGYAVWYSATYSALKPSDRPRVAYSDFVVLVQSGEVDQITATKGERELVFRVKRRDGSYAEEETTGPVVDDALIATLRPTSSALPPPTIHWAK